MDTKASVEKSENWFAWTIFAVVTVIAFYVWGESRGWDFVNLSAISLFPVMGLWSWSIMWTHYAVGAKRIVGSQKRNVLYSKISAWIVLFLILLHPGLLFLGMYQTVGLFPPKSYYAYVGDSMVWAVMLGVLALMAFLGYEVLHRMKGKPLVKRNWFYISLSQAIAMGLIFIHSIALGQNLQSGWFRIYWFVLGALLLPCFYVVLRDDWQKSKKIKPS